MIYVDYDVRDKKLFLARSLYKITFSKGKVKKKGGGGREISKSLHTRCGFVKILQIRHWMAIFLHSHDLCKP